MKHLSILFALIAQVQAQPTLANSDDIAAAKARANHTGTQAHTTITGLGTAATAALSALPIVGQEDAIHHFMDQLIALQTTEYPGDGKYLVVGGGGDSMGTTSGFNPYVTLEMVRRFGQGCVASSSLSSGNNFGTGQSVMTTILGGAAVNLNNTFTYLPNGEYFSIPAAGTVTETPNSANITAGFRKVRVWYGRKTGGGVLTFTISQNGVPLTAKTADTGTGTPGTIGYVDFDPADGLVSNGKPILVVSNATATSHYLGCFMYLGSGFIPVTVGRGGSSYAQALSSTAANLATFSEAMDMRLCFHAVKEEDYDYSDTLAMMDRWAEQHPQCSHIWVGATPSPVASGNQDPESNAAMKAKALALQMCFVDGQRLLRNYDHLSSVGPEPLGWNEPGAGTGPHLSLPARRFLASWLIQKVLLGLHVPGGRFSPATLESLQMAMLSDTRTPLTMFTQASTAIGATNFTLTTPTEAGKITYAYTAAPAPVANTGRAGKIQSLGPAMNTRQIYRYRISDGVLVDGVMAAILVGGRSQSEVMAMAGASYGGFRIVHGVDTLSAQPVPFVQIAIKGNEAAETVSPKIYHSSSTGASPYGGGTWRVNTDNFYWVEFLGNGTSVTKRIRVWHQTCASGSSETSTGNRRLIADWSAPITVGGTYVAETYFGLYTNSTPSVPGGFRSVSLQAFEVDHAPRYSTVFSQQDMNY